MKINLHIFVRTLFSIILTVTFLSSCEKEPSPDPTPDSDPTEVQLFDQVGFLGLPDGPHDIVVNGNYAYACRNDVISVIDLTDVTAPVLVSEINDATNTNTFESMVISSSNILYASCTTLGAIYMIDISDPLNPVILNKFMDDIFSGNKLKALSLFYINNSLWAAGSNGSSGLIVEFNIISASSIQQNSYWDAGGSGNGYGGLWVNSGNAYASTANGVVHSFLTSNLAAGPTDSFTFTNEAGHEHWGKTLLGSGNKLYWSDWGAGFISLDISNPANLTANSMLTHSSYKSQFPAAEGTDVYDVALSSSGKLFVANGWSGLLRLDSTNPGVVEDYVDYQYHQYYCLALHGQYALLGNISGGITGNDKGLYILKVE